MPAGCGDLPTGFKSAVILDVCRKSYNLKDTYVQELKSTMALQDVVGNLACSMARQMSLS